MDKAALLQLIADTFPAERTTPITAADLEALFLEIAESYANTLDEADQLAGLFAWSAERAYRAGELTYYAGKLYQSLANDNAATQPGSNPAAWAELPLFPAPIPATVYTWNPAPTYELDMYVQHKAQLWRSLADGNQAHEPGSLGADEWWRAVNLPGGFGAPYAPHSWYAQGQVVLESGRLYQATQNLLSEAFSPELAAGKWQEVSSNELSYRGVQDTVPAGQTLRIAANSQYALHGPFTLSGQLEIPDSSRLIIQ